MHILGNQCHNRSHPKTQNYLNNPSPNWDTTTANDSGSVFCLQTQYKITSKDTGAITHFVSTKSIPNKSQSKPRFAWSCFLPSPASLRICKGVRLKKDILKRASQELINSQTCLVTDILLISSSQASGYLSLCRRFLLQMKNNLSPIRKWKKSLRSHAA